MRKKFAAAFFAAMFALMLSLTAFADVNKTFLLDNAEFLTDSEETRLIDKMLELADYTGWNVGIVTTAHDLSDNAAIMISEDYYDSAFGIDTDGVLLLMDSANGNYVLHVVAANKVRAYISTKDAQNITDRISPSFENYDEYQTASLFLDYCKLYHDGGSLPSSPSNSINIELALVFFAFAVVAAIITGSVIWQRYNKHPKISAVAYLNQNTVNIYTRSDRFVREYTTRTRRSSSSGGGGGGHHGGGHHGGGGSRGHR